ncbi:MAG TPA: hypothetical protein ENG33_10180 [Chloroflexi bacterium]|nr:hypothetical protein [Chloroflexota bacterium]
MPANSTVQGYVYNYSSGRPVPGIEVVISGGGWSTSTRSDSNGFYRFQGLGYGVATLNLRLPPGFTRANPDLKVFLDGKNTVEVNLGFYAGEKPSWPVQLSLLQKTLFVKSGADFEIGFEVRNTGSEVLDGIEVEVNLPGVVSLKGVSPEMAAFEVKQNGVKISIGELKPSQVMQIRLKCHLGTSPGRYTVPITVRYSGMAYTVSALIQVETSLPKTGFALPVGLAILLLFTIYMARYLRISG